MLQSGSAIEGTSVHIDNVRVWESHTNPSWAGFRDQLISAQASRGPAIQRDIHEEAQHQYILIRDRLSRLDDQYKALVAHKKKLEADIKRDYPAAYQTSKELGYETAAKKKALAKDPRYQELKKIAIQANKAVTAYVHSKHPDLKDLPKHLYYAKYKTAKNAMANDPQVKALEATAMQREKEMESAFPEAFEDTSILVAERNKIAQQLKKDPVFMARKKEIANAVQAIEDYIYGVEPRLKELDDAIAAAKKAGQSKS